MASASDIASARAKALELHRQGLGVRSIAKKLHEELGVLVSKTTVAEWVRADRGSDTRPDSRPDANADTENQRPAKGPDTRSKFAVENPGDDPLTAPRKVVTAQLEARAVELRAAGKPYTEIAAELGVDEETATDMVERVLIRIRKGTDAKADRARTLDLVRIDKLIASVWDRATDPKASGEPITGENGEVIGFGYSPGQDKAVEKLTKLFERRSKLLGTDAPTKHQHSYYEDPSIRKMAEGLFAVADRHQDVVPGLKAEMLEAIRVALGGEQRATVALPAGPTVIEAKAEPVAQAPAEEASAL